MAFQSFVNFDAKSGCHDGPSGSGHAYSEETEGLLIDELISSAQCENVLLYSPFSDGSGSGGAGGLLGKLFATNFRLSFQPAAASGERRPRRLRLLCDDFEVPLVAVDELQVTTLTEKKFRALTTPLSALDQVCDLKLITTDLRVFLFSFKQSQFAGQLCNQILHFARPAKLEALLNCRLPGYLSDPIPSFNSRRGWEAELGRSGAVAHGWRVSSLNMGHRLVPSYPEALVVPGLTTDAELLEAAEVWAEKRFPIWCWSSSSGCAIARSSEPETGGAYAEDRRERVEGALRELHPRRAFSQLVRVDIPRKEIAAAYRELKRLLAIHSWAEFSASEVSWQSKLGETGWLQLVGRLLKNTASVVASVKQDYSVIIREAGGRDVSAAVSSLAQLCLDPYFRTVPGFQTLIQKEWTAMGHPFGERLFGVTAAGRDEEKKSPVFLLFLDGVSQLLRRFPADFAFGAHFLIATWDLALSGLSLSLATNGAADRQALERRHGSAWTPELYFRHAYRRLFENPLYELRHEVSAASGQHVGPSHPGQVLTPEFHVARLYFWEQLFLRWVVPAHIMNGGEPQEDVALECIRLQLREARGSQPRALPSLVDVPSGYPYCMEAPGLVPREPTSKTRVPLGGVQRRASLSDFRPAKDRRKTAARAPAHNRTADVLRELPETPEPVPRPRHMTRLEVGLLDGAGSRRRQSPLFLGSVRRRQDASEDDSPLAPPLLAAPAFRASTRGSEATIHRFAGKTEADLRAEAKSKFSTAV